MLIIFLRLKDLLYTGFYLYELCGILFVFNNHKNQTNFNHDMTKLNLLFRPLC